MNDLARFVTHERRADDLIVRAHHQAKEAGLEIPFRSARDIGELQRFRASTGIRDPRLFERETRSRELRLGERGVRQHAVVTAPRRAFERGAKSPEIFPRDMREGRLPGHVAERVDAGRRCLEKRIGFHEALGEFDAGSIGREVGSIRRPARRNEEAFGFECSTVARG
jgi:hypothetical protein